MAPPQSTLTVKAATPYSIQIQYLTSGGAAAYVVKSSPSAGDIDLSSFHEGPLKAALANSSDWTTLYPRLIVRTITAGAFNNANSNYYAVDAAAAVSIVASFSNNNIAVSSGTGHAVLVVFEIRLVHSAVR